MVVKPNQKSSTKKIYMDEEKMSEEELELYKQNVKTMEWLWGLDETRIVLGHLKGMKEKKKKKEKNV